MEHFPFGPHPLQNLPKIILIMINCGSRQNPYHGIIIIYIKKPPITCACSDFRLNNGHGHNNVMPR